MKVYNYDEQGYLIGESILDDSDKCQITGDWLIPAQATDKEPLEQREGYNVKFNGSDWEYEQILTDEEKKIQGLLSLEEGEKIVDGSIVVVTSPGKYYVWNYSTLEWELDEEAEAEALAHAEALQAEKDTEFLEQITKWGLI